MASSVFGYRPVVQFISNCFHLQSPDEVIRAHGQLLPADAALCRVSCEQKCVCVCLGVRTTGIALGERGGVEAWEEETSKTGEIGSRLSTKQAIGFRDKGNAIRHVTVNAMHAFPPHPPSLAPFSFSLIQLYQAPLQQQALTTSWHWP